MKTVLLLALTVSAMPAQSRLQYPDVRRSDHKDTLHGVSVADPYRWLEAENSDETKSFVARQAAFARAYLDAIPGRDAIARRLTELQDYSAYGFREVPAGMIRAGSRYFFYRRDPGRQQFSLYMRESLDGPEKLALDAEKLSADGTASLASFAVSPNGKRLAYGISRGGSDWREIRVRDLDTLSDLADTIAWAKFTSPAWTADSQAFFYSRFPEPAKGEELSARNLNHAVHLHKIGTPQRDDRLIWSRPDESEWILETLTTADGRYAVFHAYAGTDSRNRIFLLDLSKPGAKVVPLIDRLEAKYVFAGAKGDTGYVISTAGAPKGRILAFNFARPSDPPREVVAETADTLEFLEVKGSLLFAGYSRDVKSVIRIFRVDGQGVKGNPAGEVALPGPGAAEFGASEAGPSSAAEFFYSFTGFTTPGAIYRYDIAAKTSRMISAPHPHFDPGGLAVEQVFYPSKDGTKIPMFLMMKKGTKRDGSNPVMLYAYGGFNVNLNPAFSAGYVTFAENGGIVAVANLRGGGEYGEAWHQAGMKEKKQNVFDDFIAAAEYLIAEKYTTSKRLAIRGGSNGGLLVGAVLNQRPGLFGAAIPMVGVMDMLRFHKFTIGAAWATEYGSPDDPKDFAVIRKYSPLHNIKPGTVYPPTLITTADHDDRVVPAHSFKYAAALQNAQEGRAPILIRIETSAGHGAGISRSKAIELETDIQAFLQKALSPDR